MSRYVEIEMVQNCLDNLSNKNLIGNENDTFISLSEAKDEIEELPAADVVEVVRCKDCKYSEIDKNGNLWCAFYNEKIREMPNGYCWHGERKEK